MDKQIILDQLDTKAYFKSLVPSLKDDSKGEAVGLCPLHKDNNPSLSVNYKKKVWLCRAGCGGGDIFEFYQRIKGVNFPTAIKEIIKKN